MPKIPSLSYALGLPPKDAIKYFESKGYVITQSWHDLWQEAHAKAFTVAGVARLDILQDIKGTLDTHLREGKTAASFQKELEPILRKKGWWGKRLEKGADGKERIVRMGSPARLNLIFRQNIQTAYMAGRYKRMKENAEARPFWKYVALLDSKTRPAHKMLHGRIFRHDDAFWNSHYPPNGWGCRCRIQALSPYNMEKQGLKVESGKRNMKTKTHEVTNRHTGEVVKRAVRGYAMPKSGGAVAWTDVGFSYNAGQAAFGGLLDDAIRKLEKAPHSIASATVTHLSEGEALGHWLAKPEGNFPLAILSEADAAHIGSKVKVARLSPDTLEKQRKNHPELTQKDYALVQRAVDEGEVYRQNDTSLAYILNEPEGVVVVVKVTEVGDELYVTSVRRLSRDDVKRDETIRALKKSRR